VALYTDIKPGNILLDRDGQCKLADFGLSQVGMFKWMQTARVYVGLKHIWPQRFIRAACMDLKWTGGLLDASCSI